MRTGTIQDFSKQVDIPICIFKTIISPLILIWKTISDVKKVGKPYEVFLDERDQHSFHSIFWISDKKLN